MKKTTAQSKTTSTKKTTAKTRKNTKKNSEPALQEAFTALETPATETKTVSQPSTGFNTAAKLGIVMTVLLLALAGYAYNKYWIVATVNGQPISRLEYYQTMEKQVGKQTLDNLITDKLINAEAAKKGVKVSQTDIDSQLSQIENQLKNQGQTLDQALALQGMTKTDLVDQIKLQKTVEVLAAGTVKITDDQINKFLTDNKDQLPKGKTQDQLKEIAKTQLESEAKNESIRTWLTNLRSTATVLYR